MAKQSGLGDNIYVHGYDLSGDVGQVQRAAQPSELLAVTGLDKSGMERLFGHKDGAIDFQSFFNDAALQEHAALKTLNRSAQRLVSYHRGVALGSPVANLDALQMNYDWNRGTDASLVLDLAFLARAGVGLEWGQSLTAGKRTDTGATSPGTGVDFTDVSTAFGMAAYLQVFSFTGTDVTIRIQDSASSGSGFANITGLNAFTTVTSGQAPLAERIETDTLTRTIQRYLKVNTTTSGGFSSLVFAVSAVRYTGANRDT